MTSLFTNITIETLVLVAIWKSPFIFQGCFKIADKNSQKKQFIFFRCECNQRAQYELIENDFSPQDYEFTLLYNEAEQFYLNSQSDAEAYAVYLLKYALNTTLIQMITQSKQHVAAIDDEAMQAIMKRMEPLLKQNISWNEHEQDIGFAVAMDFYPSEDIGELAVCFLLKQTNHAKLGDVTIH